MLSPGDAEVASRKRTDTMKQAKTLLAGLLVAAIVVVTASQPAQAEETAFVAVERPECTVGADLNNMSCWLVTAD